jgi:hypothetical protein
MYNFRVVIPKTQVTGPTVILVVTRGYICYVKRCSIANYSTRRQTKLRSVSPALWDSYISECCQPRPDFWPSRSWEIYIVTEVAWTLKKEELENCLSLELLWRIYTYLFMLYFGSCRLCSNLRSKLFRLLWTPLWNVIKTFAAVANYLNEALSNWI